MIQIKLDAIDSTNDFLKANKALDSLSNFTVVTAESQTNGRGQRGATWVSEPGKNLTFSILVKDFYQENYQPFELIIAVSVSIHAALQALEIPQLSIKWPNDIMAGNFKIGGILIENLHKGDKSIVSIVGVGINVNQLDFEGFPQASSIAACCHKQVDKQVVLEKLVANLAYTLSNWASQRVSSVLYYQNNLFRKGMISSFQTPHLEFAGVITGVTTEGKLVVVNEFQQELKFDLKEIKLLF